MRQRRDGLLVALVRRLGRLIEVNTRFRLYMWAMATPLVAQLYQSLRGELRDRRVVGSTEMLIEGFPRSANSYVAFSMQLANPGRRISSHLHSSYSLRQARRRKIPCVFVVREPDAAVASLMQMLPQLTTRSAYQAYIAYHRRSLRNLNDAYVVAFDDAVNALPSVMAGVLSRTKNISGLICPPDDAAFRSTVRCVIDAETALRHDEERVEFVTPRPSEHRRGQAEILGDPTPQDAVLRNRARAIYEAVLREGALRFSSSA